MYISVRYLVITPKLFKTQLTGYVKHTHLEMYN